MSLSHSPLIVRDGLVLCLDAANPRSYPKSGTTWSDLAGANDGTLTNGPTFDADDKGSIVFDGSNDYVYVSTSDDLNFAGESNITISCWVKMNSRNDLNTFIMWEDRVNLNGRELRIGCSVNDGYQCLFQFFKSPGGNSNSVSAKGTTSLLANVYYSAVGTFNGSIICLYLNGSLEGTTNVTGTIQPPEAGTNARWIFGAGELNESDRFLNGNMSNVSIYNRALTASEVLQNYNATRGRYGI
jgi:hypothetical protein